MWKRGALGALGQWAVRILTSRWYLPVSVGLAVVLSFAIAANLLARAGDWPPVLVASPPAVVISGPTVVPSSYQIQVVVLGAVQHPGSYPLIEGAHVRDAVNAAGGMLTSADATRVSMDAPVSDGGFVYVPHAGETPPTLVDGRVDLNLATVDQMHAALGISTTIARRIVAYRTAHGLFTAISQLLLVPLSKAEYDRIKLLVAV